MKKTNRMLSDREISDFCDQLAMILKSGISLSEGLGMMLEDAQSEDEKRLLEPLKEDLEQTGIFWEALQNAKLFPKYMVQMVKIGEQTGHLDDVMVSLSLHYDLSDSIRQSIRSAVLYPAMMFLLMLIIVTVLLTNVMPIFNQVFLQLGTQLSGVSRVLLNLGQIIKRYMIVLSAIAAVLVVVGVCLYRIPKARTACRNSITRIPFVRRLCDALFLFRFSSGMTLALSSGMAPEDSLDMVEELTGQDPEAVRKMQLCREKLQNGEDFCQALCQAGIFSGIHSRMAAIGQKTGSMEQVMQTISRNSQEDFNQKVSHMLGLIEPTLVVVLSLIVGIILMSVMFPLLGILSGM